MSQSKASGRKSVAGMGSIRKKEKVINGKAYTYYEARYTVGIDPGTGKQIQKSISGKTQREVTRRLKEITTSIDTGTYLPSCKLTAGEWLNTWISEYTADWKPLSGSMRMTQTAAFTVLSVRVKMERTICCLYVTLLRLPARITVSACQRKRPINLS